MAKEITLPIYIVDAFTNEPFKGNGAAVCLLPFEQVLPNSTKQKIAAEMNLSETAFISPIEKKDTFQSGKRFALQWFTPTCEVPLCGHATLASSTVLFSVCNNQTAVLEFETLSGTLTAKHLPNKKVEINLPAYESKTVNIQKYEKVIKAAIGSLSFQDVVLSESGKLLVRLKDDYTRNQLQGLNPSAAELLSSASDLKGVIVTLKGSGLDDCKDNEGNSYDFISRYFAPWLGVFEDPVTGSAHSVLAPFWSKVLNKTELYARQCSARGGDLSINLQGDRVAISGHSVVVLKGEISF